MNRRTFVKAGLTIIGLGVIGILSIPTFTGTVMKILKKDTATLKLNHEDIMRFMDDASREQFWSKFSRGKKLLIIMFTYLGVFRGFLPFYNKYIQYRGQITGHFLLSTNFFTQKMNASLSIQYMQFYNPYKQACYNPFSPILYPETV